ncbi:MAG TPA: ATP-binding cassette domain-containing protein [Spirochaetales bacterium]|nr:ATP-binding cassette domain-containing protein [Spirochaetales bacterium]HRY54457.1 ATP-binding cassette domain-containing protein [Spirochaetia bacterium]HRZ63760.1 ATP-binding cassette domain-containing protein [Spirochaetia bacterium]
MSDPVPGGGPLLEVRDLKKYFDVPKGRLHAVDGLSFSIDAGKTLGMVGESGCGKSTTGRVLLRLHEPSSGSVRFDGVEVTGLPPDRLKELRSRMQMIFQDPYASINPRHTVATIIGEPLRIFRKVKGGAEHEAKVRELMETVGLAGRLYDAYPHELDGGRRQRIGIARALALEPRFIVCDEPVSSLDVSIQAQILNLLQDLQERFGLTYLFITHDLSVVKHISDDIAVMYLGQLIEKAPTRELFRKPLHPYTQALLSAIPVPKAGARKKRIILRSEISSPIDPKPGCRFAPRCEFARPECLESDPPLAEAAPGHFVACRRAADFE